MYDDLTIRCFHVKINAAGQTVCATDSVKKRPSKVYPNGKQGMHLFSGRYTLASMAVRYNGRRLLEAAEEVISTYHTNLLTKFFICSKYIPKRKTIIEDEWGDYLYHFIEAFKELCVIVNDQKKRDALDVWIATQRKVISRNVMADKRDVESLGDYLNLAAAIQHILPCNVIYSDNASDGEGGGLASSAVLNLMKKGDENSLKQDMKDIIDPKVVTAMFQDGFHESNNGCLAFIIMQIAELCSLRALFCNRPTNSSLFWMASMRHKKDYIYEVAHFSDLKFDKEKYSAAFESALKNLYDVRYFIESNLNTPAVVLDRLANIF